MASVGLVFGLMTGCGGGSSDGGVSPAPTPAPEVGLEPEKVNDFIGNMADELGCDYVEIGTSQSTQQDISLSLTTVGLIKKVIVSGKNVKEISEAPIISATQPGTCGGSVTLPDDGLVGTIIFDHYCMSAEDIGSKTTIDGSLTIAVDEAAETITASTPTPLTIVSSSPATGNAVNVTIDLDNGILTINEDGAMITMTALTITDNITNKVYTITNFTADIGEEIVTFSATFNNPEVTGAVDVVGSINMTTGVGTITATDQDGVEVKLSSTSAEGVFDVSYNNAPLGTMDCTSASLPI